MSVCARIIPDPCNTEKRPQNPLCKIDSPRVYAQPVDMHESNHLAARHELVLMDKKNPRSLVAMVPEAMAIQMFVLWNSPDAANLLGLNEVGLLKELKRRQKEPSPLDYKIRVKFWIEFERIQDGDPWPLKLDMTNILGRDFPKESFYKFYLTDPVKLAFLLCPPQDYKNMVETILIKSSYKILEFLDSDLFPGGQPDQSLAKKFMEINESMHRRKLALEFRGVARSKEKRAEEEPEENSPGEPLKPETPAERKERLKLLREKDQGLPGQV